MCLELAARGSGKKEDDRPSTGRSERPEIGDMSGTSRRVEDPSQVLKNKEKRKGAVEGGALCLVY